MIRLAWLVAGLALVLSAGGARPAAQSRPEIALRAAIETETIKGDLRDVGLSEKEGYWTAPVRTDAPGLYTVVQTSDKVVSYAPKRSIKSGKTFFVASKSLDKVSEDNPGFDRVYGHPLELVPVTNPVTPMGPGQKLSVKLLYKGQPLKDAVERSERHAPRERN